MGKTEYILKGILQKFDTKVDSQSRVYPQEIFLKHLPKPESNDHVKLYESEASSLLNDVHDAGLIEYYEERCHKNVLRGNFTTAAYYNRKMIYSIEDKIFKKHCKC